MQTKQPTDFALRFLLTCCRHHLAVNENFDVDFDDHTQLDSAQLIELIAQHRLFPVVYSALTKIHPSLPSSFYDEIKNRTEKNRQRMMKLAGELLRIHELLQKENVGFISYKGPVMVHQIFSDFSQRQTRDLDILIHVSDLDKVIETLTKAGFVLLDEYFIKDTRNRDLYLLRENHVRFSIPGQHLVLEVHWALSKYFTTFNTEQIFQQTVSAYFLGKDFRILPLHLLFVYLCAHGTYHKYESLFWLFDIAWIIQKQNIDFSIILKEAEKLKCRQVVVSSIFLSHHFFNVSIPESFPEMNLQERFLFKQCKNEIEKQHLIAPGTRQKGVWNILHQRMQWLLFQMFMTNDTKSRKRILFLKMIKPYVWDDAWKIPSNKLVYLLMTQIKWIGMLLKGKMRLSGKVVTSKKKN